VAGPVHASSGIRLGSETGAAVPWYPDSTGLVIRRVASTNENASTIVARTDKLTLERDGTATGLLIRWTVSPGNSVVNATGITTSGTQVTFHYSLANPGISGTNTVFSSSQGVSHYDISFGNPYAPMHMTHVVLDRYDTDYYMVGTITSSYNQ